MTVTGQLYTCRPEEQYLAKCNVLFQHVYEAYVGEGKSIFNQAT